MHSCLQLRTASDATVKFKRALEVAAVRRYVRILIEIHPSTASRVMKPYDSPGTPGTIPAELLIDAVAAAARRKERAEQTHTLTIPRLRFIGFSLIAVVGVALHNLLLLGSFSITEYLGYILAVELYCVGSWLILRRWFGEHTILGDLFLTFDLLPLLAAVWVTGGTESSLFWLPLMRVVDQATAGVRRTMWFSAAAVAGYGAVAIASSMTSQVNWGAEAAKVVFLSGGAIYICLTAWWTEALRARTTGAIRLARQLIDRLNEQSAELLRATMRAEAASKAKTEFLGRVSHELRRPATTVIGFSQLLEMSPLNERQADFVARVSRAGRDLASLVDEVLDLVEVPAASLHLKLEPVVFDDVVIEVLAALWPAAAERAVRLISIGAESSGIQVYAERRALRRVLWNLLSHLIRSSLAEDQVSVWLEAGEERVRFCAQDSGPGVVPDDIGELLTPALDGGAQIQKLQEDGLGLAFARSLVLAMNGAMGVHAVTGQACTYWFDLPLARVTASVVD